jgi:hypothetical protein
VPLHLSLKFINHLICDLATVSKAGVLGESAT